MWRMAHARHRQNFNPPAPGTSSFMLLAAARAMGRLRIVRNLPNSGSLIRLRVVWRLFLANTSSDSLRSTEIRRFVQRPKTQSLVGRDRKSTRLNSSHGYISYAVFCLKKKKNNRATDCLPSTPHAKSEQDPTHSATRCRIH